MSATQTITKTKFVWKVSLIFGNLCWLAVWILTALNDTKALISICKLGHLYMEFFPELFFCKVSYHKVFKYTRVIFLAILSGSIARLTGVNMHRQGSKKHQRYNITIFKVPNLTDSPVGEYLHVVGDLCQLPFLSVHLCKVCMQIVRDYQCL